MRVRRIPKEIVAFPKSFALIGDPRAETGVIFVHGFGGSSSRTWQDFHGLVDEHNTPGKLWHQCNLFFFSYDSIRTPVGVNGERLGSFVEDVVQGRCFRQSRNSQPIQPAVEPKSPFIRKLIFVGHSEGAVVIRRMILDRFGKLKRRVTSATKTAHAQKAMKKAISRELKKDPVLNSMLRLFAPACLGTNFSSFFGFALSLSTLVSAIAASSLVRNELLPDSPILKQIQSETENAARIFPPILGMASKVLFGDRDQVVYTGAYNCDEISYVENRNHFTVCQPKSDYTLPLEFVSS
jgi:hypothetical protein